VKLVYKKKWALIIALILVSLFFVMVGSILYSAPFNPLVNNSVNQTRLTPILTPAPTQQPAYIDSDGDNMSDAFEQTISHTDPHVHNARYALLVDANTPAMDIMQSFLINEQKFLPENVIKLTGNNVTYENIKEAVYLYPIK
jgi:hypothetical protein